MLTFTFNIVSSLISQSLGLKGEAFVMSLNDLAVALPWVKEFSLAVAIARLRRPAPAVRAGMMGNLSAVYHASVGWG
jgi:hypothetical protein